ncbi:MAG: hypothetical protein QMC80_08480 [Thermoplasmatales archaeon]|nr:hypothetical protein [Thermoplasmatales archaeon]
MLKDIELVFFVTMLFVLIVGSISFVRFYRMPHSVALAEDFIDIKYKKKKNRIYWKDIKRAKKISYYSHPDLVFVLEDKWFTLEGFEKNFLEEVCSTIRVHEIPIEDKTISFRYFTALYFTGILGTMMFSLIFFAVGFPTVGMFSVYFTLLLIVVFIVHNVLMKVIGW